MLHLINGDEGVLRAYVQYCVCMCACVHVCMCACVHVCMRGVLLVCGCMRSVLLYVGACVHVCGVYCMCMRVCTARTCLCTRGGVLRACASRDACAWCDASSRVKLHDELVNRNKQLTHCRDIPWSLAFSIIISPSCKVCNKLEHESP
jgi:hypothetical protein